MANQDIDTDSAKLNVTDDPVAPSRFLALAPELRTRIYEYVFAVDTGGRAASDILKAEATLPQGALTRTCRQLRGETKGLYEDAVKCWAQQPYCLEISHSRTNDDMETPEIISLLKRLPLHGVTSFEFLLLGFEPGLGSEYGTVRLNESSAGEQRMRVQMSVPGEAEHLRLPKITKGTPGSKEDPYVETVNGDGFLNVSAVVEWIFYSLTSSHTVPDWREE